MNKKIMKKEAISRLKTLCQTLDLNPNLIKYFRADRLYYSYTTAGGMIGSIDTIDYISQYRDIVNQFEKENNVMVYHAIEYPAGLCLLYVSDNEEEWEDERPDDQFVFAKVYVFDENQLRQNKYVVRLEEYGEIGCSSLGGAIVRIG